MAPSTKLEDRLEGIETFEHGNIGLVSFLERMILKNTSKEDLHNLKRANMRRSTRRT